MVRNHQGNKQPIELSLVNQTTSKADYTTDDIKLLRWLSWLKRKSHNLKVASSTLARSNYFFCILFIFLDILIINNFFFTIIYIF